MSLPCGGLNAKLMQEMQDQGLIALRKGHRMVCADRHSADASTARLSPHAQPGRAQSTRFGTLFVGQRGYAAHRRGP